MTKQQQIEEMYQDFIDYRHATLFKVSTYEDMCKNFVELGYQKIGEDKIVLPIEEYEMLLGTQKHLEEKYSDMRADLNFYKNENKTLKQYLSMASQEIAKEFAQTLISLFWEEEAGETIRRKDVQGVIRDVLRMHYQVEVEL